MEKYQPFDQDVASMAEHLANKSTIKTSSKQIASKRPKLMGQEVDEEFAESTNLNITEKTSEAKRALTTNKTKIAVKNPTLAGVLFYTIYS